MFPMEPLGGSKQLNFKAIGHVLALSSSKILHSLVIRFFLVNLISQNTRYM